MWLNSLYLYDKLNLHPAFSFLDFTCDIWILVRYLRWHILVKIFLIFYSREKEFMSARKISPANCNSYELIVCRISSIFITRKYTVVSIEFFNSNYSSVQIVISISKPTYTKQAFTSQRQLNDKNMTWKPFNNTN